MFEINNMKINLNITGSGKQDIILLHGWGHSIEAFKQVQSHLEKNFKIYSVDLPGFGMSDKPPYPFNTEDYANVINDVIKHFRINKPIIIGHSFGGRVSIKYVSKYNNIKKLVLIDSAGIVNKKTYKYYIKVYYFKLLKRIFSLPILKKYKNKVLGKHGSSDYKNADELMKKILVKVVSEDLRNDLLNIKCPTLLVWGRNDTATPLSDAYTMENLLIDAGLVIIENAGHFSYLENLGLFLKVLDSFFIDDLKM
ncbi:MAG: alpha/beta hydrolase fold protein [Haloplasmataceae bacterium]|jgi:pimeloyl-ACP methyl ester carboxylesterase|nr:alpha/beta hydrolase fold protein [Haloplasmataceae bacterium]